MSSPSHENQGIGRKLVAFVEKTAKEAGLTELITLSTQAFTYFQSKGGFAEGTLEDLPSSRRAKYKQSGRKSKVLESRRACMIRTSTPPRRIVRRPAAQQLGVIEPGGGVAFGL